MFRRSQFEIRCTTIANHPIIMHKNVIHLCFWLSWLLENTIEFISPVGSEVYAEAILNEIPLRRNEYDSF